jgi:hypothetical protein
LEKVSRLEREGSRKSLVDQSDAAGGHMNAVAPYEVQEWNVSGDTKWIAIRARGADWCWLTPAEALAIGRAWVERYGAEAKAAA